MKDGLNPAQREAVAKLKGPLLVLAGAGTGKTRVITFRIANLIRSGVSPDRILAVTFTNKAAREMRERAQSLLGRKLPAMPLIATFHSLCVNVLRSEIEAVGYHRNFTIVDRNDSEAMARSALREARIEPDALSPRDLLNLVGRWKTAGIAPREARLMAAADAERLAAEAYARYQQALKAANSLDFDDLLMLTDLILRNSPEALERQRRRWDSILVDEYQDTSGNQYRIIKALAAVHRNLCVVGDDDQSIYGWRGAEIRNILDFQKDFAEALVVRLEENYRCCPSILGLANNLIRWNSHRHAKLLRSTRPTCDVPRFASFSDESTEAAGVVSDIADKVRAGTPLSAFAILFRTNEQARPFEAELRARNLPYRLVGGLSFYDRREVRDVLAYLKTVANPKDEPSLLRILNMPARGIGDAVRGKLLARAVECGQSLWEIMPQAINENALPSAAIAGLRGFVALIVEFQERLRSKPNLALWARELIQRIGYEMELRRQHSKNEEFESRWTAVGEVLNAMGRYEAANDQPSLDGFLQSVAVDSVDDDDEAKGNRIILMTIHSAKGLEFPQVYLVGLEEGLLPHERSVKTVSGIDEERRLLYVGVTRARDRITLTRAETRMRFGKSVASLPSRFLPELQGHEPLSDERLKAMAASSRGNSGATARRSSKPPRGFTRNRFYRKR